MDCWPAIIKVSRSEWDMAERGVWVWSVITHSWRLVSCQAEADFVAGGNLLLFLSDRGTLFQHYISFWLYSTFASPAHPPTPGPLLLV